MPADSRGGRRRGAVAAVILGVLMAGAGAAVWLAPAGSSLGFALGGGAPARPAAVVAQTVTAEGTRASGSAASAGGASAQVSPRPSAVRPGEARAGETPTDAAPARTSSTLPGAGDPVELDVPALGVGSAVVPISGQSGVLLPPSDPTVLGWWREGAVPGAAVGSAVITGHTVHTGGGSFDHLDQLRPGDRLRVRTVAGTIRYVVRSSRVYRTGVLARDAGRIFRLDGPGRLVLVTCDDWNGVDYLSNAVVVAMPIS